MTQKTVSPGSYITVLIYVDGLESHRFDWQSRSGMPVKTSMNRNKTEKNAGPVYGPATRKIRQAGFEGIHTEKI